MTDLKRGRNTMKKVKWLLIGAGEIARMRVADAVRSNIIIDAVYKSSAEGKEIKIGGKGYE
jgi:hypothetical protein